MDWHLVNGGDDKRHIPVPQDLCYKISTQILLVTTESCRLLESIIFSLGEPYIQEESFHLNLNSTIIIRLIANSLNLDSVYYRIFEPLLMAGIINRFIIQSIVYIWYSTDFKDTEFPNNSFILWIRLFRAR